MRAVGDETKREIVEHAEALLSLYEEAGMRWLRVSIVDGDIVIHGNRPGEREYKDWCLDEYIPKDDGKEAVA